MRAVQLIVCAAAAAALLTACTQDGSDAPAAGGPGSAGATAGTTTTAPAEGLPELKDVINASLAKKTARFVAALSGSSAAGGQAVPADGELRVGQSPALHLRLHAGKTAVELVQVANVLYLKYPGYARLNGGKPWFKIAADNPAQAAKVGPLLPQVQQFDPVNALILFARAGRIDSRQTGTVDGVPTIRYRLTVSLKDAAGKTTDPQLKDFYQTAVRSGLTSFPVEVLVGKDKLPQQLKIATSAKQGGGPSLLIKYRGWGTPVQIAAPPADQVGQPRGGN